MAQKVTIESLPREILFEIFQYLETPFLLTNAALVCKEWFLVIKHISALVEELTLKWPSNGGKARQLILPNLQTLTLKQDPSMSKEEFLASFCRDFKSRFGL